MARDISPHTGDPVTGNCVDCGATREMIDDALVPTCRKFSGPHKFALVLLNRHLMWERSAIEMHERQLQRMEEQIVHGHAQLAVLRERERQLASSLDCLAGSEEKASTEESGDKLDRGFSFFIPPGE